MDVEMNDLDDGRTMALRVGTEQGEPFWLTRNGERVALVVPASSLVDNRTAQEPAGYRCWQTDNYTHHAHQPGQPCPLSSGGQ